MAKKHNEYFMQQTINELAKLSTREAQLVAGLARICAFLYKDGETPLDTIKRSYPRMNKETQNKVSLALETLLSSLETSSSIGVQ